MTNQLFFTDPTSIIDKGANISKRTRIWHHSHITQTAIIGDDCTIGQNCYVAGKIGNGCKLQNNVNIYQGVTLEDFVFCGPSMTFTNVKMPRAKYPTGGKYSETKVKTGATIGAHSVIVCGVTVGKWVMVGAGSVVTKDVPDFALIYGNPAEIHGWVCECGEKLPDEFSLATCDKCKKRYQKTNSIVKQVSSNE